MATAAELARLDRLTGRDAEITFLQLMTRHHLGGVEMAKAFLSMSTERALTAVANGIVTSQQYELDLMRNLLRSRGASA